MQNKKIKIAIIGCAVLAVVFGTLALVGALSGKNEDSNMKIPNVNIEADAENMLMNDKGVFVGEKSDLTYFNGEKDQYKVKSDWLYVKGTEDDQIFCLSDINKMIDKIVLGSDEFKIDDLMKHDNDAISILKALNDKYGIKVYDTEKNLIEVAGKVDEASVEEKYSYDIKRNDLDGKVYFFDVNFNAMSDDLYKQCLDEYKKATETEECVELTGSLMLAVYKDSEGNVVNYDIIIESPVYYNSFDNFKENMFSHRRFDVTKCHAVTTDGVIIGIADNLSIRYE